MKELALQVEDERRQSDQYKDQVCLSVQNAQRAALRAAGQAGSDNGS